MRCVITCSVCGGGESKVLHTDGARRRRQCLSCYHRWSTAEIDLARFRAAESAALVVCKLAARLGPPVQRADA